MYRFILAIILIIVLSISLKYILFEQFSVNEDERVVNAIKKNNEAKRKTRKEDNEKKYKINRQMNINHMEAVVEDLREKILSARDILNNEYPTCRKIDLYPNIDFNSPVTTRTDDRFANEAQSYLDKIRGTEDGEEGVWGGHAYGQCSKYINSIDNCRMDPYCQVVRDDTNGFKCNYKRLNHDCYTISSGVSQPKGTYLIPETFDNI